MCLHQPRCPQSDEPDRLAARIIADRPEQGWSLLCNGVVLFEDDSELVTALATTRRARENRARENRAYVRTLLARRQPRFARALAIAEQEVARLGGCPPQGLAHGLGDAAGQRARARLSVRPAA